MNKFRLALTLVGLAMGVVGLAKAQTPPTQRPPRHEASLRWQSSFDDFAAADQQRAPAPGGVLFVGSSSIRLWSDLESAFGPASSVTRRGFGGSSLRDCVEWVDRLVLPYRPRLVVLYAGDNDIAEGATPEEVAARFDDFVAAVRSGLPGTRIVYLSIKPSPLRVQHLDAARAANALIAERVRRGTNLDFVDVFTPMLGPDGQPRENLYGEDRLHLNAAGYALWRSAITEHLGSDLGFAPPLESSKSAAAR